MIYAFIRGYIGGFGRAIMDFYIANSFLINAIILIYGLCVYLAHISYLKAYRIILISLGIKISKKSVRKNSKLDFQKVSWDEVRRSYWFPLIAPPKGLLVSLKTNASLQNYFSAEKIRLMLNLKNENKE